MICEAIERNRLTPDREQNGHEDYIVLGMCKESVSTRQEAFEKQILCSATDQLVPTPIAIPSGGSERTCERSNDRRGQLEANRRAHSDARLCSVHTLCQAAFPREEGESSYEE